MQMESRWISSSIGLLFVSLASSAVIASDQSLAVPNCRVALVRRAALAGPRLGILRDISVAEGDRVDSGQIIAQLRDEQPRQVLAVAEKETSNTVDLRLQQKISELATLEYAKAVELNKAVPGGFSDIDVKKLRLAAEKSVLQIEQADFQLQMAALRKKEAEVTLETYRIVAPFSGIVLQINKQPGEALGAGETVAEIANFDVMRVEGFIPVTMSSRVQRGAAVVVELAGPDPEKVHRFEGRIKHIAPIVNEVSQEVRVWAEVENRKNLLKDGLPATMNITLSKLKADDVVDDRPRRSSRSN